MTITEAIARIKEQVSIPELLRKYGHQVSDRDQLIKSPIRDDSQASFSIFAQGRKWKDHATADHGDVIDLFAALEECGLPEAIRRLCGQLGIALDGEIKLAKGLAAPRGPALRRSQEGAGPERWEPDEDFEQQKDLAKGGLYSLLLASAEDAINHNHHLALQLLCDTKGFEAHELLSLISKRGMNIGAAPGQATRNGHNKGVLFYYMPHGVKMRTNATNSRGDRWLHGRAKDNLFRPVLYAEDMNHVIFVEGETDAISVAMAYHRNRKPIPLILGIPGARITPSNECLYEHLRHKPKSIVVCFDNDETGEDAANKFSDHLRQSLGHKQATTRATIEKDLSRELQLHGHERVVGLLTP